MDAMRYLIKPVREDKLFETMDQAVEKNMAEPESNYVNTYAILYQVQESGESKTAANWIDSFCRPGSS